MIFQKLTLAVCLSALTFSAFAGKPEFEEIGGLPAVFVQLSSEEQKEVLLYTLFDKCVEDNTRSALITLQPHLGAKPFILDLSARMGKNGEIITDALAGQGTYLGVNTNRTDVKDITLAQKLYPTLQFKMGFEEDYMEGINLSSYCEDVPEVGTADVVFMFFMASKKYYPKVFLMSIYDRMKPGSRMIIMEPHQDTAGIEAEKRKCPGVDPRLFDLRPAVLTKEGVDLKLVFRLESILSELGAEVTKTETDICETGKQAKPRLRGVFNYFLDKNGTYSSEERSAMLATVDTISDSTRLCSGQMHTFIAKKPDSSQVSSSSSSTTSK